MQRSDLNSVQHLWDEQKHQKWFDHPTSVLDLTVALVHLLQVQRLKQMAETKRVEAITLMHMILKFDCPQTFGCELYVIKNMNTSCWASTVRFHKCLVSTHTVWVNRWPCKAKAHYLCAHTVRAQTGRQPPQAVFSINIVNKDSFESSDSGLSTSNINKAEVCCLDHLCYPVCKNL